MILSETRSSLSESDVIFFRVKSENTKKWQIFCIASALCLWLWLYFFDIESPLVLPIFLASLFALSRFFYLAEKKSKYQEEIEYSQKLIVKGYAKQVFFEDEDGTKHYHYEIGHHIIAKGYYGAVSNQLYEIHFSIITGLVLWMEKIKE